MRQREESSANLSDLLAPIIPPFEAGGKHLSEGEQPTARPSSTHPRPPSGTPNASEGSAEGADRRQTPLPGGAGDSVPPQRLSPGTHVPGTVPAGVDRGRQPPVRLPPGWQSRRHPPPSSLAAPRGPTPQPLPRRLRVPQAPVRGAVGRWTDSISPTFSPTRHASARRRSPRVPPRTLSRRLGRWGGGRIELWRSGTWVPEPKRFRGGSLPPRSAFTLSQC